MTPKVFISYSWTSPEHKEIVRSWADQLINDGIEVVIDIYDLSEGDDKFAFMERMVADETITHVLVICDKKYSDKANTRKDGVGTETQIISKEVYEKVEHSKFVPIVCEFDELGQPFLPIFLKSRIYFDFSTPEEINKNWESLVRHIYGKPLHQKPELGKPPIYITYDISIPTSNLQLKFNILKQAFLQGKNGLRLYRSDFLDACFSHIGNLRMRDRPSVSNMGEKVFIDAKELTSVRDHIIDWVLLESTSMSINNDFSDSLTIFLERLKNTRFQQFEQNRWNDAWYEVHSIFVYETFLYIIAALIKNQAYHFLHDVFNNKYLIPSNERNSDRSFETFSSFWGKSDSLQSKLAPSGKKLNSPAAEFVRINADREDLSFENIKEADLLALLMASLDSDSRWFPQILYYSPFRGADFPIFARAIQHRHFQKLAIVTDIDDADTLREKVRKGFSRLGVNNFYNFYYHDFWDMMNMDNLDKLK